MTCQSAYLNCISLPAWQYELMTQWMECGGNAERACPDCGPIHVIAPAVSYSTVSHITESHHRRLVA
jgi:hypothetical protein